MDVHVGSSCTQERPGSRSSSALCCVTLSQGRLPTRYMVGLPTSLRWPVPSKCTLSAFPSPGGNLCAVGGNVGWCGHA